MFLWVLMIVGILCIGAGCNDGGVGFKLSINSVDSKDMKFALKDVVVDGDDGGYIAATLKGEFLQNGAVSKEDGAVVRCIYKSINHEASKVVEYRLACSGTEPGGLSVSSAQTKEVAPPSLSEPWPANFHIVVAHLSHYMIEDFQRQMVTQIAHRNQEQAALTHAKVVSSSAQTIPTH